MLGAMRFQPAHTRLHALLWALAWLAASGSLPLAAQAKHGAQRQAPPPEPASQQQPEPEPEPTAAAAPVVQAPTDAGPNTPAAPPPPAQPGDYAGAGAESDAPQEDFASDTQEYRRPERREFSVRLDPLNWLLLGRLGVELEGTLWKFLSVQITPIFVTAQSPIALNYAGFDNPLTQHSNGIGPISGASIGVGAWLSGRPFYGYVIRLEYANYGYEYRASDSQGVFDKVQFTERRLIAFFGSHSRFGPFTFAGGFGLGYELHQVERCGLALVSNGSDSGTIAGRSSDCNGKQQIALSRKTDDRADLNGPLHPVYFQARFSLGVVF
jgi:hypothetical protein